jgi:hypothetical protein
VIQGATEVLERFAKDDPMTNIERRSLFDIEGHGFPFARIDNPSGLRVRLRFSAGSEGITALVECEGEFVVEAVEVIARAREFIPSTLESAHGELSDTIPESGR